MFTRLPDSALRYARQRVCVRPQLTLNQVSSTCLGRRGWPVWVGGFVGRDMLWIEGWDILRKGLTCSGERKKILWKEDEIPAVVRHID